MAKITVHGGSSNVDEPVSDVIYTQEVESVESNEDIDTNTAGGTTVNYVDLTVPQLREELSRRGLDTTGLKAELVERLEDSDTPENDG